MPLENPNRNRVVPVAVSRIARVIALAVGLTGGLLLWATPLLALDPSIVNTQYGLSFWVSDDGLPQNSVMAMAQTPDG